jgi:mono/diheme cytochrome c family protein/plastocyanin
MRKESLARLVLGFVLGFVSLAFAFSWYRQQQVVTLRARMPEQGGWTPGEINAAVGHPLHLRLTSNDVLHSFAVGKMDLPAVDILPGEVSEVTLVFDRPGKYTYYCTRWCGPNHWRMRGTIEVSSGEPIQADQPASEDTPLYLQLGLDIDAPHPAQVMPESKPISALDKVLDSLPAEFRQPAYYRTHSPAESWGDLRADPSTRGMKDQQVWSLLAAVWQANTSQQRLAEGKTLFTQNCAACHGQDGGGDGVFADQIAMDQDQPGMHTGNSAQTRPADFTDSNKMLGASPALLHGKILRGGMGTGMPYWGPIFTDEQIWSLVDYLWTFQFDYDWEVAR